MPGIFANRSGSQAETSGLPGVSYNDDMHRILEMPLRDPLEHADALVAYMTNLLKKPEGTMTLRPLQALGLVEAHDYGGMLGLLSVGEGKTLLSYLLPTVTKADHAVLIVPAAHLTSGKTEHEFAELAEHWQVDPKVRFTITSYQLISIRPTLLDDLDPDLIIADEVHKLKNPKSACTKRVRRYMQQRAKAGKRMQFCGLSGTLTDRSFRDWWHLQQWALPPEVHPLPYHYPTMLTWCEALDEKLKTRRPVGELSRFAPEDPTPDGIRTAFGERLRKTPGVVASSGGEVAASIQFNVVQHSVPAIDELVSTMRKTWATPAEEFSEASDLWRHAREMANGFYYKFETPPPPVWSDARREFNSMVRQVLKHSRTYDSMSQVKEAYADAPVVHKWVQTEPTFKPVSIPVWFTDYVVEAAAEWARKTQGLVWVEHIAVGQRLEQEYGLPYFGQLGRSADGRSILKHKGACAVSQAAISEGFNLQYGWYQNLILNMQCTGFRIQQLMGRTHRQGQPEDTVHFTYLATVPEQVTGFRQMQDLALYQQQTTGQKQKLCLADITHIGALGA